MFTTVLQNLLAKLYTAIHVVGHRNVKYRDIFLSYHPAILIRGKNNETFVTIIFSFYLLSFGICFKKVHPILNTAREQTTAASAFGGLLCFVFFKLVN